MRGVKKGGKSSDVINGRPFTGSKYHVENSNLLLSLIRSMFVRFSKKKFLPKAWENCHLHDMQHIDSWNSHNPQILGMDIEFDEVRNSISCHPPHLVNHCNSTIKTVPLPLLAHWCLIQLLKTAPLACLWWIQLLKNYPFAYACLPMLDSAFRIVPLCLS